MILHRPGIALQRAMRVGMAAELVVIAPDDGVTRQRHHLLGLLDVEHLGSKALVLGIAQDSAIEPHLVIAGGKTHPPPAKFSRVAQQFVHDRPESLLFGEERRMVV